MLIAATRMGPGDLIAFENEVARRFNAGEIRYPVHLHHGNEDQLLSHFRKYVKPDDWVCSNWRSHYHCLLKGVPQDELMMAIMEGRSIALNFPDYRIVCSAMVGGTLPIAVGLGWALKRAGISERQSVVHCFMGDMTAETGIAHECMKYCANHGLPVHFMIEDNGVSVCSNTTETWGAKSKTFPSDNVRRYRYESRYPHAGAGRRIQF